MLLAFSKSNDSPCFSCKFNKNLLLLDPSDLAGAHFLA